MIVQWYYRDPAVSHSRAIMIAGQLIILVTCVSPWNNEIPLIRLYTCQRMEHVHTNRFNQLGVFVDQNTE